VRWLAWIALLTACSPPGRETGCEPGGSRCSGNRYETCNADGAYVVADDCVAEEKVCVAELGCSVCSPGRLSCGGDGFDIVRCNSAGSQEDTIGRCDPEVGELCGPGGVCADACSVAAEARSYEGCSYWAVDLDNAVTNDQGPAAAQQFSIVVTNPLELPADVKVEVNDAPPGEPPMLRVVASVHLDRVPGGGDLEIIDLDPREVDGSSDPRLNDGTHTALSSNAYHLTSTAPIVAYQFNPLQNVSVYSNDASLLIPESALDGRYLVMGWPQTLATTEVAETNGGIDLRAFLTIVGTQADTLVSVTLSTPILGGGPIPAAAAGETFSLFVGAHDVINLETDDFGSDFTGTTIVASKPVAVFSGSEASDVPLFTSFEFRDCCADHLEEQLFPEVALGKSFVGTRSPGRTVALWQGGWNVPLLEREADVWRVLASADETLVVTNLPPPDFSFVLDRGEHRTLSASDDFVLLADKPVAVAQFQTGQEAVGIVSNVPGGDPSFTLVPPIEQWRAKYVFLVPNKYMFDFLLLSFPLGTEILYDGLPLSEVLPGCAYASAGVIDANGVDTEYISARCPLSAPLVDDAQNPAWQDDGRHTVSSVDGAPFGLVVYGFDRFVSYAYPGGANVRVINVE
jgi:hypothetical protein